MPPKKDKKEEAPVVEAPVEETVDVTEDLPQAAPPADTFAAPVAPEPVVEAPQIDYDGLTYGIICTECGRFIPDPMGEKIVGKCGGCGGKVTYGLKKDLKEIVNGTRRSLGLSDLL